MVLIVHNFPGNSMESNFISMTFYVTDTQDPQEAFRLDTFRQCGTVFVLYFSFN